MTHKNQLFAGIIATAVIAGGTAFYGGTVYEKNQLSSSGQSRSGSNGFARSNGQNGDQHRPGGGPGGISGPNTNGDFATGEITSKDEKSVTIKARDGSSKIVYFSNSTTIGKSTQGSVSDLNNGEQIMVTGKNSPDGTMSAQNIQIRPNQPQN